MFYPLAKLLNILFPTSYNISAPIFGSETPLLKTEPKDEKPF